MSNKQLKYELTSPKLELKNHKCEPLIINNIHHVINKFGSELLIETNIKPTT